MINIPNELKGKAPFSGDLHRGVGTRGGFITYEAHLRAYGVYSAIYGTSQSAQRLSERGGFGVAELDAFYPEWKNHIVK